MAQLQTTKSRVLGAPNYTYAETTLTQRGRGFPASNVRALASTGVPPPLVSHPLKSAVYGRVALRARLEPKALVAGEERFEVCASRKSRIG